MNNQKNCADGIKENKVLPHKTFNLIHGRELEEEILIEICESLTKELKVKKEIEKN